MNSAPDWVRGGGAAAFTERLRGDVGQPPGRWAGPVSSGGVRRGVAAIRSCRGESHVAERLLWVRGRLCQRALLGSAERGRQRGRPARRPPAAGFLSARCSGSFARPGASPGEQRCLPVAAAESVWQNSRHLESRGSSRVPGCSPRRGLGP